MTEAADQSQAQEFFDQKRSERLAEAERLWPALVATGFQDDMVLLLDFVLFGRDEQAARSVADQLKATYRIHVSELPEQGWMVLGTTKPYGSKFNEGKHRDWVAFVSDIAGAHGLIFSAWSVEVPSSGVSLSSELFAAGARHA